MLFFVSRLGSIPKSGVYRALAQRDFRLLWLGSIGSTFAMQMQIVARGWLTYDMTGSPLALTWVLLSFMLPWVVFSPLGGILADRLPKKPIMVVCQIINAIAVTALAVVIYSGHITFWHFIYFGAISGSLISISMPTRTSIIPELIDRSIVVNALALQSSTFNLSRIVGPVLAGGLIAFFAAGDTTSTKGVGLVYFVICGLHLVSIVFTVMMRYRGDPVRKISNTAVEDLVEGIRYLRSERILVGLLLMSLIPMTFGFSVTFLLPVFTKEALAGGPVQLGLLTMAMGVGAVFGSLGLAVRGDIRKKGRILFHTACLWIIFLTGFALSDTLPVSMAFLALSGFSSAVMAALNMSVLQLMLKQELRGRVNALVMMCHGLMPLGIIPVGWIAEVFTIELALLAGVVGLAASMALIRIGYPELWRIGLGHSIEGEGQHCWHKPAEEKTHR